MQVKARNTDKKLERMQSKIMFKIREMRGINEQISKKITDMFQ